MQNTLMMMMMWQYSLTVCSGRPVLVQYTLMMMMMWQYSLTVCSEISALGQNSLMMMMMMMMMMVMVMLRTLSTLQDMKSYGEGECEVLHIRNHDTRKRKGG